MTPFKTEIKDLEFWEHYCEREKDVMGTLKGEECNWCGMTEEVVKHNNKQREYMRRYEEWREDERQAD